jgi:hypothetical protein
MATKSCPIFNEVKRVVQCDLQMTATFAFSQHLKIKLISNLTAIWWVVKKCKGKGKIVSVFKPLPFQGQPHRYFITSNFAVSRGKVAPPMQRVTCSDLLTIDPRYQKAMMTLVGSPIGKPCPFPSLLMDISMFLLCSAASKIDQIYLSYCVTHPFLNGM